MCKNARQLKSVLANSFETEMIEPNEDNICKEISILHDEIKRNLLSSLNNALLIGQLLSIQKEKLKHGNFTPWVNKTLPFSDRTARNYMRLYRERDKLKTENVTDLTKAYKLLRQLTWSQHEKIDSDGKKRKFMTLSLDEIQNDIIQNAVDKAKELLETSSTARALEHIAYDWFMEFADERELIPIERAKQIFEYRYNVQLKIHRNRIE